MNVFDQMASQETLICTLSTDLKKLINRKHIEEYIPGKFTVNDQVYDVEVRTRGNARKTICYMPPFKIKFNKKQLEIEEPNSFKLVNSCKKGTSYEQLLVKEFFVYKLYNIITPKSLNAIMLDILYESNTGKGKPSEGYAFMLEDEESFAAKHGGVIYEPKVTFYNRLDTFQLALMTMFEYMIGNTDWAIGNQHNCFIVRDTVRQVYPFPVAYDFDYSGMVNAPYAIPQKNTPIKGVRTRFNRGRCMTPENMKKACEVFISKKEEIMEYTETFPYFTKASKSATINYLESFYKAIEDDKRAKNAFCNECKPYEIKR